MKHEDYVTVKWGTAVTRKILDNLGSPDDGLKIIHIAGTNGKGSTAEFFTRILISAGKKVGTFTSPAVYDFYDQFKVGGVSLPEEAFEKYFVAAREAADGLGATDFEIQTAATLYAFYKEGCEWAVVECGMGGRDDATNAIHKKELAVITSLSLEHTEYLGSTIEEICARKAGIIKDCPVVVNAFQPFGRVKDYFKSIGAIVADKITDGDGIKGEAFVYGGKEYRLPATAGAYQRYNASVAIEGAKILGLPEDAVYDGIKNARLSGRVEIFAAGGRTYILDGAHNPWAFEDLKGKISVLRGGEVTVIFGCLKDKDIDGILSSLSAAGAENCIAVPCPNPRTRSAEEVEKVCKKYFKNVTEADGVAKALEKADTEYVAVCGSFTLLKEAKRWIEKRQ